MRRRKADAARGAGDDDDLVSRCCSWKNPGWLLRTPVIACQTAIWPRICAAQSAASKRCAAKRSGMASMRDILIARRTRNWRSPAWRPAPWPARAIRLARRLVAYFISSPQGCGDDNLVTARHASSPRTRRATDRIVYAEYPNATSAFTNSHSAEYDANLPRLCGGSLSAVAAIGACGCDGDVRNCRNEVPPSF